MKFFGNSTSKVMKLVGIGVFLFAGSIAFLWYYFTPCFVLLIPPRTRWPEEVQMAAKTIRESSGAHPPESLYVFALFLVNNSENVTIRRWECLLHRDVTLSPEEVKTILGQPDLIRESVSNRGMTCCYRYERDHWVNDEERCSSHRYIALSFKSGLLSHISPLFGFG